MLYNVQIIKVLLQLNKNCIVYNVLFVFKIYFYIFVIKLLKYLKYIIVF